MKRIFFALLIVLAFALPAFAAGTCTQTVATSITTNARIPDSETVTVTLACTADSDDGTFPSTVVAISGASTSVTQYNLYGYYLYQVARKPGSPAPDSNYTVTITDTRGFALDLGLLTTNGSASVAQLTGIYNSTSVYPTVRSALTVAITANSTHSAKITLDLIFKAK